LGRRPKGGGDRICPVCGLPYSTIERKKHGDRVYLYAVHIVKLPDGSRKRIRHYIGPENPRVSKLYSARAAVKKIENVIDFLGYAKLDDVFIDLLLEKAEKLVSILRVIKATRSIQN